MNERSPEQRAGDIHDMGYGYYVGEIAHPRGMIDVTSGDLSADDRMNYAKMMGREWPKPQSNSLGVATGP